jgi:hypothetical protein
MRVVYEWTQPEWDEAVRLAAARKRRGSGVSSITYGVILVPVLGGAITGLLNLRHNRALSVAGTILPMLLGLAALCIVLWMVGLTLRLRRLRAAAGPMPTGECEAVLQEGGWRFCTLTSSMEKVAVMETVAAVAVAEHEAPLSAAPTTVLTPWHSMTGTREGRRVVVFLHEEGFAGVPTRCLSEDQVGHLQRMMDRKLRPQPTRR